jgi:phosphate-selective porin OprO/OprP
MKKWGLIIGFVFAGMYCAAEETNIVNAIAKDEDAGWESVFNETNQIPFHINLYMQEGLYYELVETSTYDGAFYTTFFSEKRRFTGRLGARMDLDLAFYDETGAMPKIDDGPYIRRFYVNTYGRGFFLSPLTYGLEFGVSDGSFFFNNGYLWFHEIPYIESLKLGFFKAPMSLESLQTSSSLMMMERAAPVSAFAPAYKLGIQLGGPLKSRRATLYGGLFGDGADTESGDASQSYNRYIGRGTWLAKKRNEQDEALLHFGVSASYMRTKDAGVRYRSRPENYQAPFLVDTGDLYGSAAVGYGLETAWLNGPVSVQSEILGSFADDLTGADHHFWGAYVSTGWFLTGESRPYNRDRGVISKPKPNHKLSFKNGTWGAVEAVGRISYTDLTDGAVQGGEMGILSAGLNWYLTNRHRIMMDAGYAEVDYGGAEGGLYIFQARLQLDF